jgi:hypothetical protein
LLVGAKQKNAKLTDEDARMIIYTARTGLFTQREVAKQHKISEGVVSEIINKKRWKHVWMN